MDAGGQGLKQRNRQRQAEARAQWARGRQDGGPVKPVRLGESRAPQRG